MIYETNNTDPRIVDLFNGYFKTVREHQAAAHLTLAHILLFFLEAPQVQQEPEPPPEPPKPKPKGSKVTIEATKPKA